MIRIYVLPANYGNINCILSKNENLDKLNNYLIYQSGDYSKYILSSLKMMSEINKIGTLEFDAPYNSAFSKLYPPRFNNEGGLENTELGGAVYVFNDDDLIWAGIMLNKEIDFYGNQHIICYDELYILQNTLVDADMFKRYGYPYKVKAGVLFREILDSPNGALGWLDEINAKNPLGKWKSGMVSSDIEEEIIDYNGDNYEFFWVHTGDIMRDFLLDNLGGYIFLRRTDDNILIDYLSSKDLYRNDDQILDLDSIYNLKINMNLSDCYNGVMGGLIQDDGYAFAERKDNPSAYFLNMRILKIETFRTDNAILDATDRTKKYYEKYIEGSYPKINIEIDAFDKSLKDPKIRPIKCGDLIRVISKRHNIDNYFLCSKVEKDFLNPQNNKYYIGADLNSITDSFKNTSKKFNYSMSYSSGNLITINKRLTDLGG